MSLFGVMGTAISGMSAQANKLASVGDNVANSGTVGYKNVDTQFSTLLGSNSLGSYESDGVTTTVRYDVSGQGVLQSTSTVTNLGIQGNGFFVVSDKSGAQALTRAGAFVPDASGNLINTGGYYLMGYNLATNPTQSGGAAGLSQVNIPQNTLNVSPSTAGTFSANLPSTAAIVPAGSLPSDNNSGSTYTDQSSIVAYDNLGGAQKLDVYMTKTADSTWEMSIYNNADAPAGGGFPYANGPLTTQTLTFDPTTGRLASGSANSATVAVPNGKTLTIDLSNMAQLATVYSVTQQTINGSTPSALDHVEIAKDGTFSEIYANGAKVTAYKIPLASVPSPDSLTQVDGNVFMTNSGSGDTVLGSATGPGLGSIASSSLEQSTVDLATELSNMIVAQRGYEANSKVLQVGAELLHVITQIST